MAAAQIKIYFDRLRLDENDDHALHYFIEEQDVELRKIFEKEKENFVVDCSVKGEVEPTLSEIRQHIDGIVSNDQFQADVLEELEDFVQIGHNSADDNTFLSPAKEAETNIYNVQHHLKTLDATCEKCVEIEEIDDVTQLKPGDHIRFRRNKIGLNLYNHHAIVVSVNIKMRFVDLVHFQKEDGRFMVIRKTQKIEKSDIIDRINYYSRPFTETEIIERAEKMAEVYKENQQHEAYSLTGNNCEHKSNEIVTGVRSSDQVDSVSKYLISSLGWLLKCLFKLALRLLKGIKNYAHRVRNGAHILVAATFFLQIDHLVSLREKLQQGLICAKCYSLEHRKVLASVIFSLISIGLSLLSHMSWLYFGIMSVVAIALPFIATFMVKSLTRAVQPAADIPKTLVKSKSMVNIGDVITFTYQELGHEGVVTDLKSIQNNNLNVIKVDLVHFNYPGSFGTRTVVRETFFFDLKNKSVWVYDYTGERVLNPKEVVKRAKEKLQTQDFNMLSNRSSHLCASCKTGSRDLKAVPYRRVIDIGEIKPGDIINFYYYGFPHGAVVIQVENPESIQCKVVHYKYNGILGTRCVAEETFTFKLEHHDLFVHNYLGHDVFPPSEVVKRARSRIGEKKFNTLRNRSSHVAKWCKVKDLF